MDVGWNRLLVQYLGTFVNAAESDRKEKYKHREPLALTILSWL